MKDIRLIARLMREDNDFNSSIIDPMVDQNNNDLGPYKGFENDELKLAARYIQLVGCPDRARELLDKVIEAREVLSSDDLDDAVIDEISKVTPYDA